MKRELTRFIAAIGLLTTISVSTAALGQKQGGVLRVLAGDSPPSLSMHEEVDAQPARMAMPIFNNLIMFDQHVNRIAWPRSCLSWRPAGAGTRMAPR
jgi:hypothetical protein